MPILAPIGEELFFRGFATTAWVKGLGVARGIVRGGLFFALIHVLQIQASSVTEGFALAFIAFAVRVPIGLMLGWLFIRRDTIWAPIGLHAAFNGILLLLAETVSRAPAGVARATCPRVPGADQPLTHNRYGRSELRARRASARRA